MFLLTTFDGHKKIGQFEFSTGPVTIGRDPESTILLPDASVSRDHARLEPRGNYLLLRDQGSSNGTFVNGQPIDAAFLEDGDSIRIGRFELRLMVVLSPAAPPVPGPLPPAAAPSPEAPRGATPAEAGRLEEVRRSITASFARKLRSQLTVLEGNLPLLHPAIPEETFEADVLREVERTCRDLCEFADQFLGFVEMEVRAARVPPSPVITLPSILVRRAVAAAGEMARARRVLISDRLPRDLPSVKADPDRLQRAVSNLVLSMVKLSGDGAILTIDGGSDPGGLRIDFTSDEGEAMHGGDAEGSGEDPISRFTTGAVPGSGLSLAIARQIALEHGGDLLLESSRSGVRGARLSLRLPLAVEEVAATRSAVVTA